MGKIVNGIFTSFSNFRAIPILRYILRINIQYFQQPVAPSNNKTGIDIIDY